MSEVWTTREGEQIRPEDLPSLSDSHLYNWSAYLRRASLAMSNAIGSANEDTSQHALEWLEHYELWLGFVNDEIRRRRREEIYVRSSRRYRRLG